MGGDGHVVTAMTSMTRNAPKRKTIVKGMRISARRCLEHQDAMDYVRGRWGRCVAAVHELDRFPEGRALMDWLLALYPREKFGRIVAVAAITGDDKVVIGEHGIEGYEHCLFGAFQPRVGSTLHTAIVCLRGIGCSQNGSWSSKDRVALYLKNGRVETCVRGRGVGAAVTFDRV